MSSDRREGQSISTLHEMSELLSVLVKHLNTVYIVLDGIDECDAPDDLLLYLWRLREHSDLRVIFFSRPNLGFLRRSLAPTQTITITATFNQPDLQIYFQLALQNLVDLRLLSSSTDIQELITNLQIGADGMFLWARLMSSYLRSTAFSPAQRRAIIKSMKTPERLEEIYDRIFQQLCKTLQHEQQFARSVFLWLAFGQSSLSDYQLHDILRGEESNAGSTSTGLPLDEINEFRNAIIITCGGLVEFRGDKCHFVHLSATEYFQTHCSIAQPYVNLGPGTTSYYFPADIEAHAELAFHCLSYILFRAPAQPLSGSMTQTATHNHVDMLLPFLRYAALTWPKHLLGTYNGQPASTPHLLGHDFGRLVTLLRLVSRFLKSTTTIMSWIEAVYTFAGRNERVIWALMTDITAWSDMAPQVLSTLRVHDPENTPTTMAAFSQDLRLLCKEWGATLARVPQQIWNDASALTASRFIRRSKGYTYNVLSRVCHRHSESAVSYLSQISRFDERWGRCAVLTIWPSR